MVDEECPYREGCCTSCYNDLADGFMYVDDFDFGCCEHRGEAD